MSTKNNLKTATSYYTAMNDRDFDIMSSYVHPEVTCISPLDTINTRDVVVAAAKNFANFFKTITIKEEFSSENKVALLLETSCPEPVGCFRSTSVLSFENGLISKIELFYDPRPFKKEDIFDV
jgi:hypothetical protein